MEDRFTHLMEGDDQILNAILMEHFPYREILSRTDKTSLYLRRFYLKRDGVDFHLYLHYFVRGDDDKFVHDHPWDFQTLILNKGYTEELKNGQKYFREPGVWSPRRPAEWAHKVHLTKGPVWTLFKTFGKRKEWGFLTDKGWVAHDEYLGEAIYIP